MLEVALRPALRLGVLGGVGVVELRLSHASFCARRFFSVSTLCRTGVSATCRTGCRTILFISTTGSAASFATSAAWCATNLPPAQPRARRRRRPS